MLGRRLLRSDTLNPYRIAVVELARRFYWDVQPEAWRSRARMKALRDIHAGEKAVILCNGPSLNCVDFEGLKAVYTFGLNKIDLLFSRGAFRPSCIVASNLLVLEQRAEFFDQTDLPLFLNSLACGLVRPAPNRIFFPVTSQRRFAKDCSMSLYMGFTVTFVAMQLAFHMGFTDVALVGCDHEFRTQGPPNKRVTGEAQDPNHFDPSYFANQTWQLPDLDESEISYRMALAAFTRAGRRLVNATEGGRLEVLPRVSLKAFLAA